MIKGIILTVALVAGLIVVAAGAQEKNKEYFDNLAFDLEHNKIGSRESYFAYHLGSELIENCGTRSFGRKVFAEKLADESSESYKCAIEQLTKPKVLASILRFSPANPERETTNQYHERIRDRSLGTENLKVIEAAIPDTKRACQKYVDGIGPFFAEADSSEFTDSITYGQEVVARSACQVYLKNKISMEAIAGVAKYATTKFEEEKKRLKEMARQQKKMDKEMNKKYRS